MRLRINGFGERGFMSMGWDMFFKRFSISFSDSFKGDTIENSPGGVINKGTIHYTSMRNSGKNQEEVRSALDDTRDWLENSSRGKSFIYGGDLDLVFFEKKGTGRVFKELWTERFPQKLARCDLWVLRYKNNPLSEYLVVFYDGRYLAIAPERWDIEKQNETYSAYYYLKDSWGYLLNQIIKRFSLVDQPYICDLPVFASLQTASKCFDLDFKKKLELRCYRYHKWPRQIKDDCS